MLLLTTLLISLTTCLAHPYVTTPLGPIQGYHKTSFSGRTYSAFEGIPYAKPPIGPKRFEAPEPIVPWNQTLHATHLYVCAQVELSQISGDEDCLYLNVYVPRTHINPSDGLDVIVHIHGGGFMAWSPQLYAFPGYFMDHDVVFVSLNYRLGVFGFLSSGDGVVPGNNGLKDQVVALKWVQSNIGSFGGNPGSVTLSGFSAGGVSVQLHYLSPMSHGLFHRGFSQSGSALDVVSVQEKVVERTKELGSHLGCPQTSELLVQCLKNKNYREILEKNDLLYQYKYLPFVLFGPVVEKGRNYFLNQHPYKLMVAKQVQDLPWLASFVPQEAGGIILEFRDKMGELNPLWRQLGPIFLGLEEKVPKNKLDSVTTKIKEFYLSGQNFSQENYGSLVKMVTDRIMLDGIFKSGELQAKACSSVYLYEMSYPLPGKTMVEHADDLPYYFYNETGRTPSDERVKMKEILVNLLVTFAKTGKPNIDGVVWKPVTKEEFNFLNVSSYEKGKIKLETNKNYANGDFWESLGFWKI